MARFLALSSLFCISLVAAPGFSFDTGHHHDLTRAALQAFDFSADAIGSVQFENWLTDYYGAHPFLSEEVTEPAGKLHFDNLYQPEFVERYWHFLAHSLQGQVADAAEDNDRFRILMLLGIALHATQDFYSHSNWVETQKIIGPPFSTRTYLMIGNHRQDGSIRHQLITGRYPNKEKPPPYAGPVPDGHIVHGEYKNHDEPAKSGLNKDSHVRTNWLAAYVYAYSASVELVEFVREIVVETKSIGFWDSIRHYELPNLRRVAMINGLRVARNQSQWVKKNYHNGHWKGNLSGRQVEFLDQALKFSLTPDSSFEDQFKKDPGGNIVAKLSKQLYDREIELAHKIPNDPMIKVPSFDRSERVVCVTVRSIAEIKSEKIKADLFSPPDYFATMWIDGTKYEDRVIQDESRFPIAENTQSHAWQTVHFVSTLQQKAKILVSVEDEDETIHDLVDLNPGKNKERLSLTLNLRTGEIKADHPEIEVSGNRVKSIGRKDSDRASIELEVDVLELSAQMNSSWREPKRGDEGELVKAAQLLLKSAAHSVTADGEFGDDTVTAVKAFQKAQGISKSGIVDKETWKKLFKTGKEGDSGEVVRAIQHTLRFWGYPLVADGKFGAGTKEAVKEFQFATDLEEDGIVGPNTWSRLISFDRYFPREIVGSAHEIRCDSVGLGHYQAPRGSHKHAGIDVLAPKDTVVMSPFDAKVIRKAKPHADDDTLSGIYIQGKQDTDWKDFHVKMFYLKPTIAIPSGCDAGSKLGVMQRLLDSPKYNDDRMKNHIHIEVEYKGRKVNPALFTRQYAILCSE